MPQGSRKRPSPSLAEELRLWKKSRSSQSGFCEEDVSSINDFILEPTPIASHGVNVVNRIEVPDCRLLPVYVEMQDFLQEPVTTSAPSIWPAFVSTDDLPRSSSTGSSRVTSDRESHSEKWIQKFQELVEFRQKFGHCLVPLEYPENPSLAHWTKRQRGQYKVKMEGKHSTLSNERQEALEQLGFIFDAHKEIWETRFNQLLDFKAVHGHTNVPSNYEELPQLAIWCKCRK